LGWLSEDPGELSITSFAVQAIFASVDPKMMVKIKIKMRFPGYLYFKRKKTLLNVGEKMCFKNS
jgi:hypothetical protein